MSGMQPGQRVYDVNTNAAGTLAGTPRELSMPDGHDLVIEVEWDNGPQGFAWTRRLRLA